MEPLVDTVIEDARWQAIGLAALASRAGAAVAVALTLPEAGLTCCLLGCDDARIVVLNGNFRGKPQPTNVLSWPAQALASDLDGGAPGAPEAGAEDDAVSLGDIAIAYDTCAREALAAGKPLSDHVAHLVVHGMLHLLGYDHIRDGDAALMEATEVRILASLGVSDPY